MPLNFGYVGIGKETTAGTAVAPSAFFRATSPAQVSARMQFYEVPGIDAFGPVGVVPTQLSGEGDIEVIAQPRSIGHLLAGLLGLPTTTGASPNYAHTFTPKTAVPSYTVEAQDGVAVHRLVGSQVSSLEFSHSVDGVLLARASLVSMSRAATGTPATATYEADLFTVGQVVVSVGGTGLQSRATSVSVSLQFPKSPRQTVSAVPASAVDPSGEGTVEASVDLIADAADVSRLSAYTSGTTQAVSIAWAKDANTSLEVAFQAYITADPISIQNRDTGMARIRLQLKAIRTGASLVTVTLKNSQASY